MPNYQKMYSKLFNAITDTIEKLKQVQIEAEEEYINSFDEDTETNVLKSETKQ